MELVLISNARGAIGRFRVGVPTLSAIAMVLVAVIGVVAYLGFTHGAKSASQAMRSNPEFAASLWEEELISQRQLIDAIRLDSQSSLSTLAARAGRLQAHITRLDALAERLITVANLDAEEFGLPNTPAVGGPTPEEMVPPEWISLMANLQTLDGDLALREDRLDALEALIFDRQLHEEMLPEGRPIDDGWISSGFGYRTHPVSGQREFHSGVDFAGKLGHEIRAVGAGIVTWSGERWGYGNLVEINHGNGYVTRYAHNKKNLVDIGDRVDKDETIALLGSSGRSTGPHVHFEVLADGKVVNPWNFIKRAQSE